MNQTSRSERAFSFGEHPLQSSAVHELCRPDSWRDVSQWPIFSVLQTRRSGVEGIHLSLHQLDGGQSSVRTWLWVDSCLRSPWTTQNQGQAGWPLCNGHFVCSKYSRHSGHNFSLNTFFGALCIWFSTTAFSVLILAVFNTKNTRVSDVPH